MSTGKQITIDREYHSLAEVNADIAETNDLIRKVGEQLHTLEAFKLKLIIIRQALTPTNGTVVCHPDGAAGRIT